MYLEEHALDYYVKNGKPTTEVHNIKRAIKTLRETYENIPANDFGPLRLQQVRQRFIDQDLCRTNVNRFIAIIVRIFRWGMEREYITGYKLENGLVIATAKGLSEVKPLQRGRSKARETDPVLPIDDDTIEETLKHCKPKVAAMIRVQLLLACRPGELCSMRPREIDMAAPIWVYRPTSHKTMHHEKSRIIPIGPKAQLLLKPWLPNFPDQFIWRSQIGPHMTVPGYATLIRKACIEAGVSVWSPNQLRHAGATKIRQQASLDAAQVILGHSTVATTQVYAERNLDAALKIAAEVG
jgi:integrase